MSKSLSEQIKQNQFRAISLKQLKKGLWNHEYKIDTVVEVDDVLRLVEAHEKKLQELYGILMSERELVYRKFEIDSPIGSSPKQFSAVAWNHIETTLKQFVELTEEK